MGKKYGLYGTIRMAWNLNDPKLVVYEGQWFKRVYGNSYGYRTHSMVWIDQEFMMYLNYLLDD